MIRFSLVIENEQKELLICEARDTDGNLAFEFPGGEIDTEVLPPFDEFLHTIQQRILEDVSIEIVDIERLEMYYREHPFFVHTIFTARIKSGNPEPIKYSGVRWALVEDIDTASLNTYGLHVIQKISECGYCHFLRQRKAEIDKFFDDYFSRAEENLAVLEALDESKQNDAIYTLAFKQEMVHLRASLIEKSTLKKNITIQNYFQLYGRDDFAQKVDSLLQTNVTASLTLKEMIKTTVDKFIAHYDNPSDNDKAIYDYCYSLFSFGGKLPLRRFVDLLNGYIMSLVTQMWYDAGELGVSMSERRPEAQAVIAEFGEGILAELVEKLKEK